MRNWTCHMASKACPEFESSNSKILTSHGGSEISKGVFMESLVQPLGSPENHGEFMCFWLKYDIYIYIPYDICIHRIKMNYIHIVCLYTQAMFVLRESAAYCRYLEASYSRILNVWISQPLAKPVSSKRSLQNNDIITKIINDPIIASTLKCQCVCVLGIHHSKTDIEVCWEWLPAPQRTKINGLVLLVSTKPQSSLLTAPKPLFTTHISRCVHIKVHTKAMTHESNIHTLSTQPTACICELLFKLFQYTSQPQNEWLHLQMQAFLNWWFSPTSQELSSYPLQKCPKLGDVLKVLLLQFCSSSNMLCQW